MSTLLYLLEYPTLHGGERSLLAALPAVQREFQVAAVAPPSGPLAAALAERGVELVPLEFAGAEGRRRPLETLRAELQDLINRRRPTLVHANSLSTARLAGPVCADLGVTSIGHLRDILRLSAAALADLNYHRRLLAVSRATRDYHVAQGLSPERVRVLHNGVDLTAFAPRAASDWLKQELGLLPTARLVGNIGQLVLRKGQDVLALAAREIVARHPDTQFVLVGERHSRKAEAVAYEQELRAMLTTGPLAGHGHFLGTRGDVPRLLSQFDVLAHTARQEPLGRVLIEAAAAGRPIVATDVGGTREILGDDGSAAVLVPVDDAPALADAICGLLSDTDRAARLGKAARARAEQCFEVGARAAELVGHYHEVLAGG